MLPATALTEDVQWKLKPKIYHTNTENRRWKLAFNVWNKAKKGLAVGSVLGSSKIKICPILHSKSLRPVCRTNWISVFIQLHSKQKKETLAIYNTCAPNIQQHISIDAFAPSTRDFLRVLSHCDSIIGNEVERLTWVTYRYSPVFHF
jgi:heptosyltransferase-2